MEMTIDSMIEALQKIRQEKGNLSVNLWVSYDGLDGGILVKDIYVGIDHLIGLGKFEASIHGRGIVELNKDD